MHYFSASKYIGAEERREEYRRHCGKKMPRILGKRLRGEAKTKVLSFLPHILILLL
jgi:hypothetical protein